METVFYVLAVASAVMAVVDTVMLLRCRSAIAELSEAAPAPAVSAPAPAPAPVAAPALAAAPARPEPQLVAAISAALAEELGTDITRIRIKSITQL